MRASTDFPTAPSPPSPEPQHEPLEAAFRRNIASLANGRQRQATPGDQARCGGELDGLALDCGTIHGVKALNLALMRLIRPTRTAAAVISAKNEGCFLLESVAHSRAIGFEHVFLYTNDNTDGSEALLDALGRTGFVTVIHNQIGPLASPQVKAYEHSIHLLRALRDFEWVSYFDVDEFLIPAAHFDYSISPRLAARERRYPGHAALPGGRRPAAICFNWHWYGSQGEVRQRDGLVQERFTHSAASPIVKSLARLAAIDSMALIHMPGPPQLALVNAALDPIAVGLDCHTPPPDPAHGKLNHYYQKSFEEFGIKSHRGRGGAPGGLEGKGLDTFFAWDVPATAANHHPTPPCLLARVHGELAALLATPGLAAAAEQACEGHRLLSRRANGDDVEEKFHKLRRQFRPAA